MAETPLHGEFAFIDWIRKRTQSASRVLLGPGDDTAVVRWFADVPCLITTDMLLEGSCFLLEGSSIQVPGIIPATPRQIGRKSMAVNLSDIAAMAGTPVAAVVSVGLPKRGGRALAEELYLGMRETADAFGTAIVGGDTNSWDGPLTISITVFGEPGPAGIIRRAGAKVGDWLMVTGSLGGSILGKHLDFTPRVKEGLTLAQVTKLNAMIDVSDGLAADIAKLCAESRCGAVIWGDNVPISEAAESMDDGRTPLEHALGDGEDFELVFAVTATEGRRLVREQPVPGVTLAAIGEIVNEGIWLDEKGKRSPLPATGWVHPLE